MKLQVLASCKVESKKKLHIIPAILATCILDIPNSINRRDSRGRTINTCIFATCTMYPEILNFCCYVWQFFKISVNGEDLSRAGRKNTPRARPKVMMEVHRQGKINKENFKQSVADKISQLVPN